MNTKIVAHRGWAKGSNENTLVAFEQAVLNNMDGVELDIRRSSDGDEIIVSHNFTDDAGVLTLKEALEYLKDKDLEIFIELKEYSDELFDEAENLLKLYELKEKSVLFAFQKIARKFPFNDRKGFNLGIISYPWNIRKDILKFNQDFIMMGYTSFLTRIAFRLYWQIFSLSSVFKKYSDKKFVIGVTRSEKEREWMLKEKGLYALIADNSL